MPRLPMPSDTEGFSEETRAAVRHILTTRHSLPPPSSYLTYAGQAGVREEALHAVDTHGPLDGLTADEALIIRFGRELLEAPQVSDNTFNAVRARYGEQGLLELTAVMSVYTMNAAILRVMDHQAAADARHLTPR